MIAHRDLTLGILVLAGACEHFVKLLVRHCFVKLHRYRLQIVKSNVAITIFIKENEGFVQGVFLVSLAHLLHHDGQELVEINRTTLILIELLNKLLNVLFGWLEAKGSQGNFELLGLDGSGPAGVKEIESVLDLLLLRLRQLLLVCVLLLAISVACCLCLSFNQK